MPAIPDPTYLRQVALFRDMALPDLAVLNGLMRRQVFPAGVRIVVTEQLDDTAYIIRTGAVKVVVEEANGNELLLTILGPGEVIAAVTVGDCHSGACSIVSLDETTLFWIDRNAFEQCLQSMPVLSANFSSMLARRVELANERIEALLGLEVQRRIVRHLILLAREYGQPVGAETNGCISIPLRLTQGDLASFVGASRVRVNQTLRELRRREVLGTNGDHGLLIRDLSALEQLR